MKEVSAEVGYILSGNTCSGRNPQWTPSCWKGIRSADDAILFSFSVPLLSSSSSWIKFSRRDFSVLYVPSMEEELGSVLLIFALSFASRNSRVLIHDNILSFIFQNRHFSFMYYTPLDVRYTCDCKYLNECCVYERNAYKHGFRHTDDRRTDRQDDR